MGVIEEEVSFEMKNGDYCSIELNQSGWWHVHVGNVKIVMSDEELNDFHECMSNAEKKLRDNKDI